MTLRVLVFALVLAASGASLQAQERPEPLLFCEQRQVLLDKLETEPFKSRWALFLEKLELPRGKPNPMLKDLASLRWLGATVVNHSFAYYVTEEERYAAAAYAALKPVLNWTRWHRDWDWNKGAELPTAELAYACAIFVDTCASTIPRRELQRLVQRVEALAFEPYLASIERHEDWWVNEPHSNWAGSVHGQIGLLGLALRGDSPRGEEVARNAYTHLVKHLDTALLEDGGGYEGVMYWRAGLMHACVFLDGWSRTVGLGAETREAVFPALPALARERLAGYWDVYLHGPDRVYANFNDMHARTFSGLFGSAPRKLSFGGPNANLCALFESFWDEPDPLLLWAADNGGGGDFSRGISPWWFTWRRAIGVSREPPQLAQAVVFRGAGHAVLRSRRMWFALQGGWIPTSAIHKNFDLGSFVLVADGARWVHDPGYGKRKPHDHSLLTVAGPDGQPREHVQGARGRYLALSSGPGVSYAAVDLSAAYPHKDPEHRIERWVRHVLLLGDRTAVLLDEVAADPRVVFKLRLQTPCKPDVRSDSRAQLSLKGDSTLVAETFGGSFFVERSHPFALVTRPAPSEVKERLLITVLTAQSGEDPAAPPLEVTWGERRASFSTLKGELVLERTRAGWRPTQIGPTAIELGDPAVRSVPKATRIKRR